MSEIENFQKQNENDGVKVLGNGDDCLICILQWISLETILQVLMLFKEE